MKDSCNVGERATEVDPRLNRCSTLLFILTHHPSHPQPVSASELRRLADVHKCGGKNDMREPIKQGDRAIHTFLTLPTCMSAVSAASPACIASSSAALASLALCASSTMDW